MKRLLLLPLLLAACLTVPGTERSQFIVVPQVVELSLGAQAYQQALTEAKPVAKGPQAEMVKRVGQRIGEAALRMFPERSELFSWEISLLDDPQTANAWALPGGKMAVYTGLLPITQDEAGLAVVVGHEVAHAVARHGAERMSHDLVFQAGLMAADTQLGDLPAGERDEILQALVGIGTLGAVLPFSRAHESEADHLGLLLSADAGYDPQAAIGLWERMAAGKTGPAPLEFMSTHPSETTRIARLKEVMPEALELYEAAKKAGR